MLDEMLAFTITSDLMINTALVFFHLSEGEFSPVYYTVAGSLTSHRDI